MSLDQVILLVLRALHILSGLAWAGAVFLIAGVILRGRGAAEMIAKLLQDGRLRGYLARAWILSLLTGIGLLWRVYDFRPPYPAGLALNLGAVAAIIAAFIPMFIGRASAAGEGAVASTGSSAALWRLTAALLGFAALTMAIARYL